MTGKVCGQEMNGERKQAARKFSLGVILTHCNKDHVVGWVMVPVIPALGGRRIERWRPVRGWGETQDSFW